MAFLQSQLDIINELITATTITPTEGIDLLSSPEGFSAAQITFIEGLGLDADTQASLLAENRSTQDSIDTYVAEAKKAIIAGDYFTARKYLLLAEADIAATPDYKIGDREVRHRESIRLIRLSLNELEGKDTNAAPTRSGSITRVRFVSR